MASCPLSAHRDFKWELPSGHTESFLVSFMSKYKGRGCCSCIWEPASCVLLYLFPCYSEKSRASFKSSKILAEPPQLIGQWNCESNEPLRPFSMQDCQTLPLHGQWKEGIVVLTLGIHSWRPECGLHIIVPTFFPSFSVSCRSQWSPCFPYVSFVMWSLIKLTLKTIWAGESLHWKEHQLWVNKLLWNSWEESKNWPLQKL